MNKKFLMLFLAITIGLSGFVRADEGMWIPLLLKKYNYADMKAKGLKLTPEEIFSINQTSLKDAIVIFGRGCTGELISNEGLLITNHHCGYGQIQSHSSLEHDYLTNGFWAMSRDEELINKGLSVTFLVKMEDVTKKVLAEVTDDMDEVDRQKAIKESIAKIVKEATEGNHYKAIVKPFYFGNEYYLFVNEVYKDVRLVGAPPSAIGKFGGDTDNWMWPRHTGDFSMFRIYADKNNNPAEYSPDNVPYQPKTFFPVSLKGVKKGDFTMVYGYPGSTQQYLTSYAVDQVQNLSNPHKINIRENILDVMNTDMNADPKVRIQYASKNARVSNAWKKWIGENRGLKRLNAIEKKQQLEGDFMNWVVQDRERREQNSNILKEYKNIYEELAPYQHAIDYFFEAGWSMEIVKLANIFSPLMRLKETATQEEINKAVESVRTSVAGFYKDYNLGTDKKIFSKVFLGLYYNNKELKYRPDVFNLIDTKYKGDTQKYMDKLYSKTFMLNQEKVEKFLNGFKMSSKKKIQKDPAYFLLSSLITSYRMDLMGPSVKLNNQIDKLNRTWITLLRQMQEDKVFYPDANFTLRIHYGQVDDYLPRDGVFYDYYTTLDGIIEKDNPDIYDYKVPEKLKELYDTKDYGQYAEDGEVHVCFTATNHTTGGNSGSPVLNADGHLIGLNFDRNWEGTMSDIMYDPEMCRNITLDIRYCMFLIDKFAGAGHLLEEMEIIR